MLLVDNELLLEVYLKMPFLSPLGPNLDTLPLTLSVLNL